MSENPFLHLEAKQISKALSELENGLDTGFKDMLDKGLLEDGFDMATTKLAASFDALDWAGRVIQGRASSLKDGWTYLMLGDALRKKLEP